jgi:hypothetical protein
LPDASAQRAPPAAWEHKYKTLQGMHNQNVADLRRRIGERDAALEDVRKQLAEIKSANPPKAQLNPRDVETYGEDMLAAVARVVDARLGQMPREDPRIATLEGRVEHAQKNALQVATDQFYDRLAAQVPQYKTINDDPRFLDWLAQTDGMFGATRQSALDSAASVLDAQRVAHIFQAYQQAAAPAAQPAPAPSAAPAANANPPQAAQPAPASARAQLEKQIAPNTAASAPLPATPQKRGYSAAEVTKFYDDVARGRYRGREQDAAREEAAINAALAEGRIKP